MLQKVFTHNILRRNSIKCQFLEGIVSNHYTYSKSNKFSYSFITSSSKRAIRNWKVIGNEISLNNYVPMLKEPKEVPVSYFTLLYEDGEKEQYSIGKHLKIKDGDRIVLKYLSFEQGNYYLHQIENKHSGTTDFLINKNELERFTILITSKSFSILIGFVTVLIACLFLDPYISGFAGFMVYLTTKKIILFRNVRLLKSLIFNMQAY